MPPKNYYGYYVTARTRLSTAARQNSPKKVLLGAVRTPSDSTGRTRELKSKRRSVRCALCRCKERNTVCRSGTSDQTDLIENFMSVAYA